MKKIEQGQKVLKIKRKDNYSKEKGTWSRIIFWVKYLILGGAQRVKPSCPNRSNRITHEPTRGWYRWIQILIYEFCQIEFSLGGLYSFLIHELPEPSKLQPKWPNMTTLTDGCGQRKWQTVTSSSLWKWNRTVQNRPLDSPSYRLYIQRGGEMDVCSWLNNVVSLVCVNLMCRGII